MTHLNAGAMANLDTGSGRPWWLDNFLALPLDEFIHDQADVLSRQQWLMAGRRETEIRRRVRRRDWTVLFPGVYFTARRDPPQLARDLGALLYGGEGAMWCHATAGLHLGLPRPDRRSETHVLIPAHRRVRRQPGLRLYRVGDAQDRRLVGVTPPRVTAAHAVLDQLPDCDELDDALALVADSCQSDAVVPAQIGDALSARRVRWGADLREALSAYLPGSESLLEVRYVRDVERRHRLPQATRQRRIGEDISDCSYDDVGVLVELDGRLHLLARRRFRDMRKDNRATLRGEATLRYGWLDVCTLPCHVAAQVIRLLWMRGWRGVPRPCGAQCPVAELLPR